MSHPSQTAANRTPDPLPNEEWDLCDLPDVDEILYPTRENLVLNSVSNGVEMLLGFVIVLSPSWALAIVALVLILVVDYGLGAVETFRAKRIERTPVDESYRKRWLRTERTLRATGFAVMLAIVLVRFA